LFGALCVLSVVSCEHSAVKLVPTCDGSSENYPLPQYENGNGSVTYYTFSQGSTAVDCSYAILASSANGGTDTVAHVSTGNGTYFGAMNTADYNNAATCGACVEITRDGTRTVTVTIVDQCPYDPNNPACRPGHIDLSQAAFEQIGSDAEGYLGTGNGGAVGVISWRYVPCPTSEDLSFQLKEPTNDYWNQILVQGHINPITNVEVQVGADWQSLPRQSYNYWGNGSIGSAPYQVRVTDINGAQEVATLQQIAGDQDSSVQFPLYCQ
jgi:expansin (peptidoglycan-binding protein)